ncbi:MAG: PAS domain-containing protein [Planctomycetes bacterium]|nr:PAS domain-containing protein [Planctomycetota bacterium]
MTLRRFPQPDPRLAEKLQWLLFIRLAVAVLGIFSILLSKAGVWRFPVGYEAAYAILVTACCINLAYLISIRWITDATRHVLFQITVDVILEALLVYYTGGVDSIFSSLFFASVLAAALMDSATSALFFASLATVLLSGVTIIYFLSGHFQFPLPLSGPSEYGTDLTRELRTTLPYLVFLGLSLHLVALIAGKLAVELNRIRIVNREVLQNMADGMIATDIAGRVIFLNGRAIRLLGLGEGSAGFRDRAIDRPLSELLAAPAYAPLVEALTDPLPRDFELKLHAPDGGEVAVQVRTSLLPGERHEVRGMIAMLTDVSMKRVLDEAVKRSERLQALSEMSAGVAHEIRNPLASISGAVQELATLESLSAPDRRLMGIVQKESVRLDRIISDFLEFARTRSSGFSEISLTETLREVVILMEKRDASREVKVELQAPERLLVRGDAEQLKQVFYNLAINAVEASPAGATVRIRAVDRAFPGGMPTGSALDATRVSRVGTGVRVDVIDEGSGIEPAIMPRLFDPFFTTRPKGTGLGLAIAQRIVQAHRGHVTVESALNKGSIFSVWLPG